MMLRLPFATHQNFLDPQLTSDGQPYGPWRYKQIVKECYRISKNCGTSYTDLMNITPIERDYLIEFIVEEAQRTQEELEKKRLEIESKRGM